MKQLAAFILSLLYATYALAGTGMIPPARSEASPIVSYTTTTLAEKSHQQDHLHAGTIQLKKASHHLSRAGKMKVPRATASPTTIAALAPAHPHVAAKHFHLLYTPPLHAVINYLKNCVLLI
jgi:hypothetical protein